MYKLLLVEDEINSREYLKRYINSHEDIGFVVESEFSNGKEAYNYLMNNHWVDVIITDIRMPKMTGIELAGLINKYFSNIIVVILSGYEEFEDAKLAIKYNVKEYLVKPFELCKLKNVLLGIKKELDLKNVTVIGKQEMSEEQIKSIREEFFVDLLFGRMLKREEIEQRLVFLKFPFDVNLYYCDIIKLTVSDNANFLKKSRCYQKEGLYKAFYNLLSSLLENKYTFEIIIQNDDFFYAIFHTGINPINYFQIQNQINQIFKVSVNIKKLNRNFSKIYDIQQLEENIGGFKEKIMMFFTYLKAYEYVEAKKLLENIFSNNYCETKFRDVIAELSNYEMGKHSDKLMSIKYHQDYTVVTKKILDIFSDSKTDCMHSIERAKKYIENNYFKNISREDVSQIAFFNSAYFARTFKQYTGESFNDYLLKIRMKNAIELLKNKNIKVNEIAKRVGYENPKYFFHVFKLYTGYTPREYRIFVLKEVEYDE